MVHISTMKPINEIIKNEAKRASLERRLWDKIDKRGPNDCWNWMAKATHPFGYGRITAVTGIQVKAHQAVFALTFGHIPDGMVICHSCDNPKCCNPSHLFIGTQAVNHEDMMNKNRGSAPPTFFGESHHNTKFDEKTAVLISKDRRPAWVIAKQYSISTKTVYRLRRGETWKGIPIVHMPRVS